MAKRKLKGFLYSLGINAKDYPLASNLKTSFIDGSKKSITDRFYPYDCLLKGHDINNFMEFLDSVEKDLRNGIAFKIESIQIATYSVTINPFTPKLKLFMRDV